MKAILAALLVVLAQPALAVDVLNNAEEALAAFRAIMRKRVEERTGKKGLDANPNDARPQPQHQPPWQFTNV